MSSPLQKADLGALTRIGSGGQGIVYTAPGIRTSFSPEMVFKEYKPQHLRALDTDALAAMTQFLRSLDPRDAQNLVNVTAWNCGVVADGSNIVGFVMPKIPPRFWIDVTPRGKRARWMAELKHLLNHHDILYGWGLVVSLPMRLMLIRSVAANLAFLHRIGVVVGDIAPPNLLFSFEHNNAYSYFIDTDSMNVNGRLALQPVETPAWSVLPGEPPSTIHSDAYKLGLVALRLLAGEQEVHTPASIPPWTPHLLRQIIADTLTAAPAARPTPAAWVSVLDSVTRART